jgi:hypothetical protein
MDEDADSGDDSKKMFLEYDRQLMILARIANFDKTAHRCCIALHPALEF